MKGSYKYFLKFSFLNGIFISFLTVRDSFYTCTYDVFISYFLYIFSTLWPKL